jgi:homoserine O-succinyltransferase
LLITIWSWHWLRKQAKNSTQPPFPEAQILPFLDNTWGDTGKAIFNNWLGLIYKVTNLDRRKPFMEGVNPNDPLGLRNSD